MLHIHIPGLLEMPRWAYRTQLISEQVMLVFASRLYRLAHQYHFLVEQGHSPVQGSQVSVDRNGEYATESRWKTGKLSGYAIAGLEREPLCQEGVEWESEVVK